MFSPLIASVPAAFEIEGAPKHTITIPLAANDDGNLLVAAEVRLWPCFWRGHPAHEFKFAIVTMNDDTGEVSVVFDRFNAAGLIECVRPLVMPSVCAAAEFLIRAVQPPVIYRATYVTHPPQIALEKHNLITDTIVSIGYHDKQSGFDQHNRLYWLMIANGDEQ